MNDFIYDIPTKIIFGPNRLHLLPEEIKAHGSRVLLLYGKNSIKTTGLYDKVVSQLKNHGIFFEELSGVKPNPSIESVRTGIRMMYEHKLDFILAVGGGSVIDCAKAIAAGYHYDGDAWDLVIGKAPIQKAVPIGTILTLAATGSEMNGSSVISNEQTVEKIGFGSPLLRPAFTFEDPTLTFTVSPYQTAAGSVDIFAHLLENYFSSHDDEGISDRMIEAMMLNVINYAPIAVATPDDYDARANLMWTSTLALNGLTSFGRSGGDWASHAIEHEVSAYYDITHGAGLSILFPYVLESYLAKDIVAKLPLTKFTQLGRNVFHLEADDDAVLAQQTIDALRDFFRSLNMPLQLNEEKVDDTHFRAMADHPVNTTGTLGCYQPLTADDIYTIYKKAL